MTPDRLPERLRSKISVQDDGCWHWTASRDTKGYGQLHLRPSLLRAHRVTYELLVGPIPEGLTIDHLCRVRHCVNPAHMEPVTQKVNVLRGESPWARHAAKTHCVHGHEFTPENTRIEVRHGRDARRCLTCRRATDQRKRDRAAALHARFAKVAS